MGVLKKFELNNKVLDDFDKLMTYHLGQVEEIEINEIFINAKLYNIISLCTNAKTLVVNGDLRVDINKIFFNICKPEKIETIVLNQVKLPTNKVLSKFINIKTISLNNITFSDVNGFFNRLPNPEKVIALNLTNIDFGKKSISNCKIFNNLKYFNIDGLKNCKFDDFNFIYESKKIERFEFYNNEITFEQINTFCKGKYTKNIDVNIETSESSDILNAFEINSDGEISITVNTSDLEKCIDNVGLYRISNLFIILNDDCNIENYIRSFKKIKGNVTLAIKDIAYLNIEVANKFRDRLGVEFINILEYGNVSNIRELKYCYSVDEYIKIRKSFDEVVSNFSDIQDELEKFNKLYNYFKNEIEYTDEKISIKDVFLNKKSSYNFYALAINSCLKELNYDSKVIEGEVCKETNLLWNQVKINDAWYNFDLAQDIDSKINKKVLKLLRGTLLNDEQFYKDHTPTSGNPVNCTVQLFEMKKEIKKELKGEVKKISVWKRFIAKIKRTFKINQNEALPAPKKTGKH